MDGTYMLECRSQIYIYLISVFYNAVDTVIYIISLTYFIYAIYS